MKGKILLMVGAAMLLVGMLPAMSAFEAHLVNATARVVQPPQPFGKTFAASLPATICVDYDGDGDCNVNNLPVYDPNSLDYQTVYDPAAAFPSNPFTHTVVAVGVAACWDFYITVTNTYGYNMQEVVVTDNFGAELINVGAVADAVDVYRVTHTKGKSKKEPVQTDAFTTQIRITWYPGLGPLDPGPNDPGFNIANSVLLPSESQTMTVTVCTKRNPAGNQEYTSPGTYQMNSGAVLKWKNLQGQQFSETTPSLGITAVQVSSITVTPPNLSLGLLPSCSQQYTAIANAGPYSFNWNSVVNWTSSNPAFATIGPSTGLAICVAPGPTTITATKPATAPSPGVVSGSINLTVTP